MINEELLKILACPVCKADVVYKEESIHCVNCGRIYPVQDGIPVMLVEAAKTKE